ncbi:DUF421 domain-containing protein [Bacillus safensis]|uniref:YetF C-terminal domain-containing protein n=1 Tax=Bacillus safensis TaxID=561879 RepID=A0A5C0WIZ3_BACIA|nr:MULTISPECIES: DUF421 domain-containing protein [Bacillus]PNU24029.1 DUF421 domain-containing protein [Bacillus stratosphericus]APJ11863.1 hypothetical protein BSL056_13215 [Bacillus safensis]AYJ88886.1 DUF421 domain-containing protein [Bacillus safensis]KAB3541215.1 DUF421 domain-containing protein [Bacillus safensis]KAB3546457.1 DUF421 domain-containing protein [Bacillus safensis]
MQDILIISMRTIILYFLIWFIFRLMGKREIGELSILDLVIFMMIAEIAVLAIEEVEDNMLHTVWPILLLTFIQITLAYLSLKFQGVRRFLDGKPALLIINGKIDEGAMRKQRYNFDDLLIQLRENNIDSIQDVSYAILEPSGKLAVVEKENKRKHAALELPLVADGVVQHDHLKQINQNEQWLKDELAKRGYHDIEQISYCSFNQKTFYIDLKDEVIKKR